MKYFLGLSLLFASACARVVPPLQGVPDPARSLPSLQLAPGHRQIIFKWEYSEGEMLTRGDGVIRIAAPDSARLDFFLGGFGSGGAALIGDSLRANGGDMVRSVIPPVPLLWAAFGRLGIPALRDTTVVMDGDLLRADIGRPVEWRLAARGDTLVSLAHIPGGTLSEQLTRSPNGDVVYEAPAQRRKLRLTILRTVETGPFDDSIWNP